MFGNEQTELGRAIYNAIPDYYEHSLTKDLSSIVDSMRKEVTRLGNTDNYICNEDYRAPINKLVNTSTVNVDSETVTMALNKFTQETGISISIVIDEQVDVYGKTMRAETIIYALIGVALIVLAIVLIVKIIKKNKNSSGGGNNSGNNGSGEQINFDKMF